MFKTGPHELEGIWVGRDEISNLLLRPVRAAYLAGGSLEYMRAQKSDRRFLNGWSADFVKRVYQSVLAMRLEGNAKIDCGTGEGPEDLGFPS